MGLKAHEIVIPILNHFNEKFTELQQQIDLKFAQLQTEYDLDIFNFKQLFLPPAEPLKNGHYDSYLLWGQLSI